MINNSPRRRVVASALVLLVASAPLSGCREKALGTGGYLQGVVEHEERVLAFEVGGRVKSLAVKRGDAVTAQQAIAALDDEMARTEKDAREAEAEAVRSQKRLLEAGTRPEQLRAIAARIGAAKANEALVRQNLVRERALLAKGATRESLVHDLETQLRAAESTRRALEEEHAGLRSGARKEELETAGARATAAEGTVSLSAERIARYSLSAPSDGTVLDVHAETGEVLAPGSPVVTVADTARPYVDVFVAVGELGDIAVGKDASVRIDATARVYAARVEHIAKRTEFTPKFLFSERERPNLVVRVRLAVLEPDAELHAGVPAFATVTGHRPRSR